LGQVLFIAIYLPGTGDDDESEAVEFEVIAASGESAALN
jgi:hypothetical protein